MGGRVGWECQMEGLKRDLRPGWEGQAKESGAPLRVLNRALIRGMTAFGGWNGVRGADTQDKRVPRSHVLPPALDYRDQALSALLTTL